MKKLIIPFFLCLVTITSPFSFASDGKDCLIPTETGDYQELPTYDTTDPQPDVPPPPLIYGPDNPEEITAGGDPISLKVTGGTPPYHWKIFGPAGYNLGTTFPTTATNTVTAASNVTGSPVAISIVDSTGDDTGKAPPNLFVSGILLLPFAWDDVTSDDEIAPSGTAVVAVVGGVGPYTWEVSGDGFSMENATSTEVVNQLNDDGTTCGTAKVTVTDYIGQVVTGYVRSSDGTRSMWGLPVYATYAMGEVSGGDYDTYEPLGDFGHDFTKTEGKYKLTERVQTNYAQNQPHCNAPNALTPPAPTQDPAAWEIAETDCSFYDDDIYAFTGTTWCCTQAGMSPTSYRWFRLSKTLEVWTCR